MARNRMKEWSLLGFYFRGTKGKPWFPTISQVLFKLVTEEGSYDSIARKSKRGKEITKQGKLQRGFAVFKPSSFILYLLFMHFSPN